MIRIHRLFTIILLVPFAVFVAGCAEEEDPEPVVEAPPPPTPQEIKARIMADTNLNQPPPRAGANMPAGAGQAFLNQMRSIHNQHSQTPEGQEALKLVAREIETRIVGLEERELWEFVLVMCDVNDIYNPGSTRFDRTRERAQIELRKPRVTAKGIFEVQGRLTAMLDFFLPLTKETHSERLRQGEEVHGMKFDSVIGNNRGVVMIYLETGEEIQVMVREAGN